MNWLKNLGPQQKRIAAAIGAGLMLGLVVILSRGRAPSSTQQAGASGQTINPLTDPGSEYSFADNGAAIGQLTTSVSELTGQMQIAMDGLTGTQLQVQEALKALPGQVGESVGTSLNTNNTSLAAHIGSLFAQLSTPPPAAPPAQVANAGNPNATTAPRTSTAPQPTAAQAQKLAQTKTIFFQDKGVRAGLNYQLRGNVRFYESKPGKGDWGAGGKIDRG